MGTDDPGSVSQAPSTGTPKDVLSIDGAIGASPASTRQRSSWRKTQSSSVGCSGSGSSSSCSGSGSCSGSSSVCSGSSSHGHTGRISISGHLDASGSNQLIMEEGLEATPSNNSAGKVETRKKEREDGREGHMLGEWSATALAGNDIMSSCLYTVGLVSQSAGKVAPLAFVFVSIVLWLVKSVYAMAVLSFPHNGGSYNLLAHVAPKPLAAFAATLSIISYIATCVVSAVSACDYLSKVVNVSPVLAAVLLLVIFAALVLTGLKESSSIAFGIFVVHCTTLLLLAVTSFAFAASEGFSVLYQNMDEPFPRVKIAGSEMASSLGVALFLGFSSAMLGVSGYETTAQCIENLRPETFIKCLRNLWIGVTLINPLLSFLAISILPIPEINTHSDTVLSRMAKVSAEWVFGHGSTAAQLFADWMSIEAFVVLAGAVLTAFVGLDGLVYKMSLDKCLPVVFLTKNRWRGTNHYIIMTFLVLCIALIVIMDGKVAELAGIYSMAFLGVLATFIMGSMLLKTSPKYNASLVTKGLMVKWWKLGLSLALICISLLGNFLGSSSVIVSFLSYFLPIYGICLCCLYADKARMVCCPGNGMATKFCTRFITGPSSPRRTLPLAGVLVEKMDTSSSSSCSSSSSSGSTGRVPLAPQIELVK